MRINLTFAESVSEFNLGFAEEASFCIGFESGMAPMPCTPFEGPYEVTPTRETQIVPAAGKLMLEPLVVNPIPQNYGLITYSGFEITVS